MAALRAMRTKKGGKINWGKLAKGALSAGQSELGQAAIGAARGYAGVGCGPRGGKISFGKFVKSASRIANNPLVQSLGSTALDVGMAAAGAGFRHSSTDGTSGRFLDDPNNITGYWMKGKGFVPLS